MTDVLANDGPIRLIAFLAVGGLLLVLQWRFALRGDGRLSRRQGVNLAMGVIDTLVLRFGFPVLAVAWAVDVAGRDAGLLGRLDLHPLLGFVLAVLVLDLVIYWQHRLMHRIPLLWRMHRVHHADRGFDVTTAVRFHPLEIALSMGLKLVVIRLLGPDPLAVLTFELMLSLGSLWTHTDIALPKPIDRAARWLLVTPSMHRIHHSTWQPETDSNYGFHLSIWDRVFRSYRSEPKQPETDMPIGLDEYMDDRHQRLLALLSNPFRFATDRKTTPK
ncbi:sterol desaturase family protein [Wenzhouxiangella sp. XN79A]|uniref:sterol desaturase family protein n=1 Tax=Wenzhouxiangella sp. XN79A TaxID=2724193 RepID=UPI00144A6428|nr:sterol desaturase family protein [Wenzhouxiangella sp. XN79A]NKI35516.1 sterol desaturase family protein [Wenzhouxiangella sp. XN79A]